MIKIVGWKIDGNSIILRTLDDITELQLPLPEDIYKEIVKDGPPTDAHMIRDLIIRIHEVRKERILTVEAVDKELEIIDNEEKETMKALKEATDKFEVEKWNTVIKTLSGRRASCSQRRHLVKLLHQEEGALSKELLMKM